MKNSVTLSTIVGLSLVMLLNACSAVSTLSSLNIDGLSGVDFGESRQEVQQALKSFQLTPSVPDGIFSTCNCDGLVASYDGVKFAPIFLFRKGKLVQVKGFTVNTDRNAVYQLQQHLDTKLGPPQIHGSNRLYFDGGVKVCLSAMGRNEPTDYNYIAFENPE